MDVNTSSSFSTVSSVGGNNVTLVEFPWILVLPEFFNFSFLIVGVFGLHQGTEIIHPIYANLFINLLFSLTATIINILAFPFIESNHYVPLSTGGNGLSVEFHCSCWCVTSCICYIYILHDEWIFSVIPNIKVQCYLSIAATFGLFFAIQFPVYGFAISNGEPIIYFTLMRRDQSIKICCLNLNFSFLPITLCRNTSIFNYLKN